MMPTAKEKLAGMTSMKGFLSKHNDGTHSGPTSPRPATTGIAPAHTSPPAALQAAPHINGMSRADIAAAARMPVPRHGRIGSNNTQNQMQHHQPPLATSMMPPPPPPVKGMQRSKTTGQIQDEVNIQHQNRGAWEDSTVNSMFDETDSRGGSDRNRGNHGRTFSESTYTRPNVQQQRQRSEDDDDVPFKMGPDGFMTAVPKHAVPQRPVATNRVPDFQRDINDEDIYQDQYKDQYKDQYQYQYQDGYEEQQQQHELTPPRSNTLRRTRLPLRDTHRNMQEHHQPAITSSTPNGVVNGTLQDSPGQQIRADHFNARLEQARRDEELRKQQRAEQRDRELHHKRTTVFEDVNTPIEDPTWTTQAAVGGLTTAAENSPEHFKQESQQTPRPAPVQPLPPRQSAPRQLQPAHVSGAPPTAQLRAAPVYRPPNRHVQGEPSRKRQRSPDYDDAELHDMSYADLMKQEFDYDPQAAAAHDLAVPSGSSIEDKLAYYKDKDMKDQHRFFTQISMREWEESGDWFLDQFSSVVNKMKEARKNKRDMVIQFENEITVREQAVRGKIDGLDRRLHEMKEEGQVLMQGKDVDV